MIDFGTLSMTEIIRLQNQLQQELTRRFERSMALVFSDIVGTTPYFARFGDAAGRQLQQLHIDLLHECLPTHQGRIVDTAGDGAFLAFGSTEAAVAALVDFGQSVSRENAQRARDQQLQLRIGVHVGSVLTDGTVVSGDSVNLCARVAASAQGGEVRITREVFQELALDYRLSCRLIGSVGLKGVARQVELFAIDWRDQSVFPTRIRIEETHEEMDVPTQDIVSFGRLRMHEGMLANDVVLALPDPVEARRISRWHFELRRFPDGFRLRPVSEGITEVDGEIIPKGREVPVKPGSKIRVSKVLTVTLLSPPRQGQDGADATRLSV